MQSCIGKDLRTPKNEKMEEYTQKSRYDAACIYKIKAMVSQGNNLPWGRILPNIKFIFGKCNICNFPQCALQMQIHNVFICRIFLQNEFSNASSNCLYEQMQSCIGYIYVNFPQSEFSYGLSSRLKLHVQSHIVYICTIFHQNEFSNVS